jgi:hypothetical protein
VGHVIDVIDRSSDVVRAGHEPSRDGEEYHSSGVQFGTDAPGGPGKIGKTGPELARSDGIGAPPRRVFTG